MAVSETACGVKQHSVCRKEANPATCGAKPVELIVCREDRRSQGAACNRTYVSGRAFVAALEIRFQAEQVAGIPAILLNYNEISRSVNQLR